MNRFSSNIQLRRRRLVTAVVAAMLPMGAMAAPLHTFDATLLHGTDGATIDLSRFEREGLQPGIYTVDVAVNDAVAGRIDLEVREDSEGVAQVCLSPELFALLPLSHKKLDAARADKDNELLPLPEERSCEALSRFIPSASLDLDTGEQRLQLSIPQAYVLANGVDWVDPSQWDHGIAAMTLNYGASHTRIQNAGHQSSHTSATVDLGINLGAWRVRHSGYFSKDGSASAEYAAGQTFAQREVRAWNAQLTVGEGGTSGELFNSVSYRGVNLRSDPRMLPEIMGSYAPVVRGVAQTNARVTIRQRDVVILETNVAPGPFEIDDLRNTSGSGDLEVEVTEADGRVERFTVPYAAVPQLLREGQQRFDVTVGQLRNAALLDAPTFVEASLRRGVSSRVTAYAGSILSEGYHSLLLGGALNTRAGAFSGDITLSDARLPGEAGFAGVRSRGQSYRFAYSRSFNSATSFTLAAYRYSTEGFLTLTDAARLRDGQLPGDSFGYQGRQRSRVDLNLSQRLPRGTLFFNGSTADYWNENRRTTSFSLGYGAQLGKVSYNISARRTLDSSLFGGSAPRQSTSAYLSINVPLGHAPSAPRLTASADNGNGGTRYRTGVNGQFGDDLQGSYSASLGRRAGQSDVGASVRYAAPVAILGGSWSQSAGSRQLGLTAMGGMVLHGGGMVLSQRLGDTIGLVQVPDAPGASIGASRGLKTNGQGYAVVPYLSAYRRNEVAVDPRGIPLDVELKSGSTMMVPTSGAVVRAVIPTISGRNALIEVERPEGKPLAFGTDVTTPGGEIVGVIGQANRVWVRGIEEKGYLLARVEGEGMCRISYDLALATQDGLLKTECSAATAEPNIVAGLPLPETGAP